MRVIGGSFGTTGLAFFGRKAPKLIIESNRSATYKPDQVESVRTRVSEQRQFRLVGFILGSLIFSGGLWFVLGFLGAVIGLIAATALAFQKVEHHIAEVVFTDGSTVSIQCRPRSIDKLLTFSRGAST